MAPFQNKMKHVLARAPSRYCISQLQLLNCVHTLTTYSTYRYILYSTYMGHITRKLAPEAFGPLARVRHTTDRLHTRSTAAVRLKLQHGSRAAAAPPPARLDVSTLRSCSARFSAPPREWRREPEKQSASVVPISCERLRERGSLTPILPNRHRPRRAPRPLGAAMLWAL